MFPLPLACWRAVALWTAAAPCVDGSWGIGQSIWVWQELELGWIIDCLKCWVGRWWLTGGGFGGYCGHCQFRDCAGTHGRLLER